MIGHPSRWRPASLRRLSALVGALAIVVLLASCGGGGDTASSSTATAAQPPAGELEATFVDVVNRVAPEVVQIQTDRGLGSGVVFDDQGDIVTNAHVVASAQRFRVTAARGKRFSATLVGASAADDLAVIRAENANLTAASFGRSADLKVGDIVLAIGNPLGLRSSVTEGIVSALGRTVSEPGGATLPNVIQTSAPINPGNSGGALVGLDGKVVGIPTLAATDPQLGGGAAPGIGFAIPSDTVRDIASQLIEHGKVVHSHRAYLGVRLAGLDGLTWRRGRSGGQRRSSRPGGHRAGRHHPLDRSPAHDRPAGRRLGARVASSQATRFQSRSGRGMAAARKRSTFASAPTPAAADSSTHPAG